MELSRRAARTHLVASRHPKYFLRRHSAGSVSPGSGRPVRHHRLRPGALPQTLQTPPHGGRPVLRSRPRPHDAKQRSSRRSPLPRPARHYPRLWLRTPLGVGPAGLSPASSMRRPAHTTSGPPLCPASVLRPSQIPLLGVLLLAVHTPADDGVGTRPPAFRRESRRPGSHRLHAGHRLASKRVSARLILGTSCTPQFSMPTQTSFDTSAAKSSRLPSRSLPDASRAPFPRRSPRSAFNRRSTRSLTPAP